MTQDEKVELVEEQFWHDCTDVPDLDTSRFAVHRAIKYALSTLPVGEPTTGDAVGRTHLYIGEKTYCGVWLNPDIQRTIAVMDVDCAACLFSYANEIEGDSDNPMRVSSADMVREQAAALAQSQPTPDKDEAECCEGGPQWGHAWDCQKAPD